MKKLKEYNKEKRDKIINDLGNKKQSGAECEDCETELVFSDNSRLMSSPMQRRVHCPGCGFKGSIVVDD